MDSQNADAELVQSLVRPDAVQGIKESSTPSRAVRPVLLPCPFCGETELVVIDVTPVAAPVWLAVVCGQCGATGPGFSERRVAIRSWNDRVGQCPAGNTQHAVMDQTAYRPPA